MTEPIEVCTDIGGTPFRYYAGRFVFRTSNGTVYIAGDTAGRVEIYKGITSMPGDDPTSFELQDDYSAPQDTEAGLLCGGGGIDADDVIHLAIADWEISMRYITFDTKTDSYVLDEVIHTLDTDCLQVSLSLDSNGIPHVCWDDGQTFPDQHILMRIYYSNRIGGTWKERVTVADSSLNQNPVILVDAENLPIIAFNRQTWSGDPEELTMSLMGAVGDGNDALSFSVQLIKSGSGYEVPSLIVTGSGIVTVFFSKEPFGALAYSKKTTGVTWYAPQYSAAVTEFHDVSAMANGDDIFLFYIGADRESVKYLKCENGVFGSTPTIISQGTVDDTYRVVCVKWNYWIDNDEVGTNIGTEAEGQRTSLDAVWNVYNSVSGETISYFSMTTETVHLVLRRDNTSYVEVLRGPQPARIDISGSFPLVTVEEPAHTFDFIDNLNVSGLTYPVNYPFLGAGIVGDIRYSTVALAGELSNILFATISGVLQWADITNILSTAPSFTDVVFSGSPNTLRALEISNGYPEFQYMFVATSGINPTFYQRDMLPFRSESDSLGGYPITCIRLDDSF